MKVKIGRFEYTLKNGDKFLDNGACIQLMTQSKEPIKGFSSVNPRPQVSRKAWKQILENSFYIKRPYPKHASIAVYELKGNIYDTQH